MKIAIVTSSVLMVVFSVAAQAQILKCVGKDGKIEFATSCPANTKQLETGVANKPAAAPAAAKEGAAGKENTKDAAKGAAPQSLADRDAEFRKRQSEQKDTAAKSEKSATETADQKRACDSAKANLQALKDRQRMFRADPKTGERVNYDEADYVRETPVTERLVAQNCKA